MSNQSNDNRVESWIDDLRFLLGEWQAISKPGEPTGAFRFSIELQSRVIVRTNYAEYAATAEQPANRHDDLMVIYQENGKQLRADYWDSEGHVIRYAGAMSGSNSVVFASEAAVTVPRFRLSYSLGEDGLLKGAFEVAMPNAPESFSPYLSWTARKQS